MKDESFYLEMLGEYCNGRKDGDLDRFLAAGDFENYRISVHGLKSTSLTIGAKEFSQRAKEAEFACRDGNLDFVRQNHSSLMDDYRTLLQKIKAALTKN